MNICGHGLRDHLRLLAPLLGLIAGVWALRLVLAGAGAPMSLLRIFSVTLVSALSVLLSVMLIHMRRFGSYANVVLAAFILEGWAQLLITSAIAFSAFTGIKNVFTASEFSPGRLADPLHHALAHLTFGLGIGTLFGAGMGCLLLWLLRKFVPLQSET